MTIRLTLKPRHRGLGSASSSESVFRAGQAERRFEWEIHQSRPLEETELPLAADTVLEVIPWCRIRYGFEMYSDLDPMPWDSFVQNLPPLQERAARPTVAAKAAPRPPRRAHAWLDRFEREPGAQGAGGGGDAAPPDPIIVPNEVPDEVIDEAMKEAEAERLELEENAPWRPSHHFAVTVRAARTNVKQTGKAGDCTRGYCRDRQAVFFCNKTQHGTVIHPVLERSSSTYCDESCVLLGPQNGIFV